MTIDRLGEETILVTLLRDDMLRYHLDFNTAEGDSTRRGLTDLMVRIGEECGLDHRGKSYLIEALPGRESCLLIISVRISGTRRRWRIKRDRRVDCCVFSDADDLLDWFARPESAHMGYTLYAADGRYYLMPEYPLSDGERGLLNEFGCVTRESPVAAARIRERGRLLTGHNRRRGYLRYASSAAM